jgi:hypothetical protein
VHEKIDTANLTIENYATYIADSVVVHNVASSSGGSSGTGPDVTTISDSKDTVPVITGSH